MQQCSETFIVHYRNLASILTYDHTYEHSVLLHVVESKGRCFVDDHPVAALIGLIFRGIIWVLGSLLESGIEALSLRFVLVLLGIGLVIFVIWMVFSAS